MRLKSKFLRLSLDDLPDTDEWGALTQGEQYIPGVQVFSRAPQVLALPKAPDPCDFVTRGEVDAAVARTNTAGRGLNWEYSPNGARLVDYSIPIDGTGIPVLVIDGGEFFTPNSHRDAPPDTPIPLDEPRPSRPGCRIEYRGKWVWANVYIWNCRAATPDEQARQYQSYDPRGFICEGTTERKRVYVKEAYEVCD